MYCLLEVDIWRSKLRVSTRFQKSRLNRFSGSTEPKVTVRKNGVMVHSLRRLAVLWGNPWQSDQRSMHLFWLTVPADSLHGFCGLCSRAERHILATAMGGGGDCHHRCKTERHLWRRPMKGPGSNRWWCGLADYFFLLGSICQSFQNLPVLSPTEVHVCNPGAPGGTFHIPTIILISHDLLISAAIWYDSFHAHSIPDYHRSDFWRF